jgi:hypothetical protein
MIRLAAVGLAALLFALPAGAASFAPTDQGLIEFQLPSGNIGCTYVPDGGTATYHSADNKAELSCDRVEPSYNRVVLGSSGSGKKYTNVGDASCCGFLNVLDYGEMWSAGPFTCTSATSGLTCTRGAHGLKMSRKSVKAW